jgi:hypothetical protein
MKLVQFLRRVSIRKKEKESLEILLEQMPVSILVASCVMPYTGARIFIKIYLNCQDESLWKFLNDILLFSNRTDNYILFNEPILYEITPFLWSSHESVTLIILKFFFAFTRVFENSIIFDILSHCVNVSLKEVFTFEVSNYTLKHIFNFSFHRLLYDQTTARTLRLVVERCAIRQPQSSFFRDIENSVITSTFA